MRTEESMGLRAVIIGVALIALAWLGPIAIMTGAFTESIPPIEVGNAAPEFHAERVNTRDEVTPTDYRGDAVRGVIVSREFGAAAWDQESYLARFRDLLASDPVP